MALTDNLQGYWKLDEASGNAADSTANNNDLTNNATVTYATGKINNGAEFESTSSQFLSISDAAQTGLAVTGALTLAGWVDFESLPSSAIRSFAAKNDASDNNQSYLFGYREDGGPTGLHVRLSNLGTDASTVTAIWDWTPSLDTLYHVAMVYDPSQGTAANRVLTYIDGASQGTEAVSWPSAIFDCNAAFILGAHENGAGASLFFDGMLDEWGVWDRALSGTEISELYNSGAGLTYPFTVASTRVPLRALMGVGN